jgi:hypothetical protein
MAAPRPTTEGSDQKSDHQKSDEGRKGKKDLGKKIWEKRS